MGRARSVNPGDVGFKFSGFRGDESGGEDGMEIAIGKVVFLIITVWAVVVIYRIASNLMTQRRRN